MLILVQRIGQGESVFLVLRVDGLRRDQRYIAIGHQLKDGFDLERGRAAGEFAFLAALFDGDVADAVFAYEAGELRSESLDVGRLFIILQRDLFRGQGQMSEPAALPSGEGENGFAAFDFYTANNHEKT